MVLGRLPVPSILNVASTCQEMRSLSNDPSLWQHLVFRDFGKYQGYDHHLEFYHKNSFILELWLKKIITVLGMRYIVKLLQKHAVYISN